MTSSLLAALIAALIAVESGGDPNAVGDHGKAVGILQIWPEVVADCSRISGKTFTLDDRRDPAKSREMCQIYLTHYCTAKRLGRAVTVEDAARIWNGGPNGYNKKATEGYWKKVRAQLRE